MQCPHDIASRIEYAREYEQQQNIARIAQRNSPQSPTILCWIVVATKSGVLFVFCGPTNWKAGDFQWNYGDGEYEHIGKADIASVKTVPFGKQNQLPKSAFFVGRERVHAIYP